MKKSLLVWLLCLCVGASQAWAQGRVVSGVVTSTSDSEPLIGVSVLVKGTTIGTITDLEGQYTLEVPEDATILVFSFVGFDTEERNIAGLSEINVDLSEGVELDELIVVGYGSVKKSDFTSGISTVKAEEIARIPVGSVDNILQGKAAGVQITSQNGRPGGQAFVRIRGAGSFNASNEPIFVLDGVQISAIDYANISANDIENVSVLKDAAAASIYGARGSNGVILITTKSGTQKGKASVNINSQVGFKQRTPDKFDMMTIDEKFRYEKEIAEMGGPAATLPGASATPEELDILRRDANDWEDVLLRTGFFQDHNISVAGGGEKTKYFFSFGRMKEEGISKASAFSRINGRANVDFKANKYFSVGTKMYGAYSEDSDLRDIYNVQNPFVAVYSYNSYENAYELDSAGNVLLDAKGDPIYSQTSKGFNTLEALNRNTEVYRYYTMLGSLYGEVRPVDGLSIRSELGARYRKRDREAYTQPGSFLDLIINGGTPTGSKTDQTTDFIRLNWTNVANYSKTIKDQHNLGIKAGTEFITNSYYRVSVSSRGFSSEDLSTQDNAAETTSGFTQKTQDALFSAFLQGTYNFNQKYYVSALYRTDGSSRFGVDNRYANFWAASAAWNAANESFMSGLSNVDQLKLRFSVGTSGNLPTDLYRAQSTFDFGSYDGSQGTTQPSVPANAGLQWEKNFNYTVGLDFGIYNNRLSGSIDYYNRKTFDLLLDAPLSYTSGFGTFLDNVGELVNKGVEIELRADLYRSKDYNVTVYGNYSHNKNEVTELVNGENIVNPGGLSVNQIGQPINTFYLPVYAGVNPANGEPLYQTPEGEITNALPEFSVIEGKSTLPVHYGGFGTSIFVKGLTIGVDFYYNAGNYIFNAQAADMQSNGANVGDAQRADALNYWKNPGDVNVLPNPAAADFDFDYTTQWLQSGNYLRLKTLSASYDIPLKKISKDVIKTFRVFFNAHNLWTVTGFEGDPEVGVASIENEETINGEFARYAYPQSRGYTFGVNVGF